MSDKINPAHYKHLPVEAIEIIESAIQGAPRVEAGYLHGQVLKYVLRCWAKSGFEDLQKAKWYLDRLVESAKQSDLQSLKDYPFGEPSDAIPDGWRELEPKEIPSKGDRFWHDGKWVEWLVDGTVEYEYHGEKFIRKIEQPKPAFAVGDRVRVCKPGNTLDGKVGRVRFIWPDEKMEVTTDSGSNIFDPSELQPVEVAE